MKEWFWPIAVLALVGLVVVWLGRSTPQPPPTALSTSAHAPPVALATPPAATLGPPGAVVEPAPEPVPFDTVTKTALPQRAVVQRVRHRIREFGTRLGGNPEGSNAEIAKALNGGNAKGVRFLDEADVRLNENGELLDPWDTPYFFHQLSSQQMEVRSAGPDRKMWTEDDVLEK